MSHPTPVYDWMIADNATPPFCAVYETDSGIILESWPWSLNAESLSQDRAAELNRVAEKPENKT